MVARVALLDSNNAHTSTTRILSDLQFQLGATRPEETGTGPDAVVVVDEVSDLTDVEKKTP